jgi:adenylate cyclase
MPHAADHGDDLARILATGLVADLESPAGRRITRAREAAREAGIDEPTLVELIQAYAWGVARVVAAEEAIASRMIPSGPSPPYGERAREWVATVAGLGMEVFDSLHREQLEIAIGAPPAGSVAIAHRTIAFVDLRGSTKFMLACPPGALHTLIDDLFFLAQSVSHSHGVSVVKYLGDGVVLLALEAQAALDAALRLVGELGENTPLRAAAGLAHGPVLAHAGDWFGTAVNLASRLAECAHADEVLIDVDGWPAELPRGSPRIVSPRGLGRERSVCVIRVP